MTRSLLALSQCRPLVLICPAGLRGGAPSADDRHWVRRLRGEVKGSLTPGTRRISFASPDLDPKVLRLTQGRLEFGAVMGDIAAGREPLRVDPMERCVCPTSQDEVEACGADVRVQQANELDAASVVVPTEIESFTLRWGLDQAEEVAGNRLLIVGATYGRLGRYGVATFDRSALSGGTPGVHVEAFMAHQDAQGLPYRGSLLVVAVELLASLSTSAGLMVLWMALARNHKFKRRVAIYSGVLMLTIGHLLVWAGAAVLQPRFTHVATFATLAITFTALRSLLTGYEVLLNQGVEWRSIRSLWLAIREGRERSSAMARMGVVLLESVILMAGVAVLLMSI